MLSLGLQPTEVGTLLFKGLGFAHWGVLGSWSHHPIASCTFLTSGTVAYLMFPAPAWIYLVLWGAMAFYFEGHTGNHDVGSGYAWYSWGIMFLFLIREEISQEEQQISYILSKAETPLAPGQTWEAVPIVPGLDDQPASLSTRLSIFAPADPGSFLLDYQ